MSLESVTAPAKAKRAVKAKAESKPKPVKKPRAATADLDESELKSLSKADLADEWGRLKEEADALDEEIAKYRDEFDRRKLKTAKGVLYEITKVVGGFNALKIPEMKEAMGKAWVDKWSVWRSRTDYKLEKIGGKAK